MVDFFFKTTKVRRTRQSNVFFFLFVLKNGIARSFGGANLVLFYVALTELNVFILVVLLYIILLLCVVPSGLDTLYCVTPYGV